MSVTVITSTGNTYRVPNGKAFQAATSMTGELTVHVYADEDGKELAVIGSGEVVYRDTEVILADQPGEQKSEGTRAIGPWA